MYIVIPVLVDGADMPSFKDLPEDIAGLTSLNGPTLRHARWQDDCEAFFNRIAGGARKSPRKGRTSRTGGFSSFNFSLPSRISEYFRNRPTVVRWFATLVISWLVGYWMFNVVWLMILGPVATAILFRWYFQELSWRAVFGLMFSWLGVLVLSFFIFLQIANPSNQNVAFALFDTEVFAVAIGLILGGLPHFFAAKMLKKIYPSQDLLNPTIYLFGTAIVLAIVVLAIGISEAFQVMDKEGVGFFFAVGMIVMSIFLMVAYVEPLKTEYQEGD